MGVCIRVTSEANFYGEPVMEMNGLAGCKAMFHSLKDLPLIRADWEQIESDDCVLRPFDFAPWRAWVAALPHNSEHFTAMLDALERDQSLWLDFSY